MLKLKDHTVILFQGDSITDGGRCRDSVDQNQILGQGYQFTLAGKIIAENLDKHIECYNRACGGDRAATIYGRWMRDCLNFKPDILNILFGVNDTGFAMNEEHDGSDCNRFNKIYRIMLDEVKEVNPDVQLIIMEPFSEKPEDSDFNRTFNADVRAHAKVVRQIAADYGAIFVPLQDLFDAYKGKVDMSLLVWDGVHPSAVGHHLIAQRWLEVVKP